MQMRRSIHSLILLLLLLGCENKSLEKFDSVIDHAEDQFEYAISQIEIEKVDETIAPRTFESGKIKLVPAEDWTSGFFAGNLWMMYELTRDAKWQDLALQYTLPLESEKWNDENHDIGFKMYCSYGHAIKYINNPEYKDVLIQSAKTLCTRYSPVVGCIRSWDSLTDQWDYPVIIDNMMNLELLMWAAKTTGNDSFREIAVKHAQTTMKNHFRDDYSCYHVIGYDPQTGAVVKRNTHQGFADESDWSRGQAWALYGYTMMYRETGMEEFLTQAKHIANYLISTEGVSENSIPYWDFEAPNIPNEPKDASAAAVISSALFELYGYTKDGDHLSVAKEIMNALISDQYFASVGENGGFLLKHSTGSKPYKSEIDVPLVYADYYFLESLIKYKAYANM